MPRYNNTSPICNHDSEGVVTVSQMAADGTSILEICHCTNATSCSYANGFNASATIHLPNDVNKYKYIGGYLANFDELVCTTGSAATNAGKFGVVENGQCGDFVATRCGGVCMCDGVDTTGNSYCFGDI